MSTCRASIFYICKGGAKFRSLRKSKFRIVSNGRRFFNCVDIFESCVLWKEMFELWILDIWQREGHVSLLIAQINLSQKVLAIRKREIYLIKAPGTYGGGSMPPSWQCPIKALGQK